MAVKSVGIRRRWSLARVIVYLLACLAVGSYLAFEVLDLDGSTKDHQVPNAENALALEITEVKVERLIRPDHWGSGTPIAALPSLAYWIKVATLRLGRDRLSVLLFPLPVYGCVLPRVQLRRQISRTDSSPSDPA